MVQNAQGTPSVVTAAQGTPGVVPLSLTLKHELVKTPSVLNPISQHGLGLEPYTTLSLSNFW